MGMFIYYFITASVFPSISPDTSFQKCLYLEARTCISATVRHSARILECQQTNWNKTDKIPIELSRVIHVSQLNLPPSFQTRQNFNLITCPLNQTRLLVINSRLFYTILFKSLFSFVFHSPSFALTWLGTADSGPTLPKPTPLCLWILISLVISASIDFPSVAFTEVIWTMIHKQVCVKFKICFFLRSGQFLTFQLFLTAVAGGMCNDCMARVPYATLIATIMCCLGVGIFCGTMYRGATLSVLMMDQVKKTKSKTPCHCKFDFSLSRAYDSCSIFNREDKTIFFEDPNTKLVEKLSWFSKLNQRWIKKRIFLPNVARFGVMNIFLTSQITFMEFMPWIKIAQSCIICDWCKFSSN